MPKFHVKHAMRGMRAAAMYARRVVLCAMVWITFGDAAFGKEPPQLLTNERMIEDLAQPAAVDASKPISVLAFVLHRLPDEVRVHPTENYYYFTFHQHGVAWAGSLRFGPDERAKGLLELSVYKALTAWNDVMSGTPRALLGAGDGVQLEMVDAFTVRVSLGARTVLFRLNDLSSVVPPGESLAPEERFIGPIFDESATRFFLIYNGKLKLFHYVLDETVALADELEQLAGADRVLIGRRTGFAYYRDHIRPRKILIGVFEPHSRLNTWFDGPFDQLPENFIKGEELREAIIAADPQAKGAIDRLGHYLHEEGRYLIHPYMLYRKPADLLRVDTCARQRAKRQDYARCFVIEPDVSTLGPPPATGPAPRKR